jgi:hypothetical protein
MYTISSPSGQPTLSDAAQKLRVSEDDLDKSYGVVLIDPKKSLYAVLVRQTAVQSPSALDPSVQGPFANPEIGLFGPVRSDDRR